MKLTIKKGIDVDINNIAYNIYLPPSEMFEIIKLRQELNILQTELDNLIAKELNDGKEVSDTDFKRFTKETTKIYEKILKLEQQEITNNFDKYKNYGKRRY